MLRQDTLVFRVTSSTLGYYWCEISSKDNNLSFRPSLIAPVLQPANQSLPECRVPMYYMYIQFACHDFVAIDIASPYENTDCIQS